jgi:SAM-dependent methyltransferase
MSFKRQSADDQQTTEQSWEERYRRKGGWRKPRGASQLARRFLDFMAEYGEAIRNGRVLDLGCGHGDYLEWLAQNGYRVTGVDISTEALKQARKRLEAKGLAAELTQGKTTDLSCFLAEIFILVFSKGVIHHNDREGVEKSFKEAVRVLLPGGFFLCQVRSIRDTDMPREEIVPPDTVGYTAQDTQGEKEGVVQHYFTREELVSLAKKFGLEIIQGPQESIRVPDEGNPERKRARWWVVFRKP